IVGAERIAACLLFVVERLIELLDHGSYRAHRLQYGLEPLAHGLEPPRRRAWQRRRTRRLEDVERFRGGVLELVERGALGIVRLDRLCDPLDRPVRQPGGLPAAKIGADAATAAGTLSPADRAVAGTLRPSDRGVGAAVL